MHFQREPFLRSASWISCTRFALETSLPRIGGHSITTPEALMETNLLLTEGSELATSIGASFITIPPDGSSAQIAELARFFERVRTMVPKTSTLERPMKKDSDAYSPLVDYQHHHHHHNNHHRKDSSNNGMYGNYRTSHSAGTLLSDSSASGESTLSTGQLERVTSAASAPALRNSNSAMSISYSSAAAAVRPRRRVAPMMSPLKLPIPHGVPLPAPLATPEMVDIAPEYSVVQDALADDEHIYATLDFSSKPEQKIPGRAENKLNSTKKEKKRPLRSRMFSNHSSTEPSSSPSTVASQPSSAGSPVSVTRDDVAELKYPSPPPTSPPRVERRWLPKSPMAARRPAKTVPIKPRIAPKPKNITPPKVNYGMPARSITMDVINRDSVVRARQIYAQGVQKQPGLRQSLSVESFADLMGEKKKKFQFVRKVATSFRFKKPTEKEPVEVKVITPPPRIGTRSLPQSPQVERKPAKKPAYLGKKLIVV
ncbi:hypothetical protein Y032_0482g2277 [Ancylostoma ceylanicum]|uniref:Uncharacterized protein n=2 Tax=Ancylostoma ceylanicum TaxID=53326 RepID=A0A016WVN2_9BILA|nr:hypothetical protein Y032_0482g2277 [Ancylostoma ceylanicum]